MSGGWSTTPPRADEPRSRPRATGAWVLLGVLVVLAAALLVWRPWAGSPPVALPTTTPTPVTTLTPPEPSASPDPLPSLAPSPGLTSTSNVEPGPTPPGQTTVFDLTGAQALFVTAEQVTGALPPDVGQLATSTAPAPGWGLPEGGAIIPASCRVARTVVADAPAGYAARDWVGDAVTFRQEVTLLGTTTEAHRAFATLVGTVDACAAYTEVDPSTGNARWTTQPAIEGEGLYPSVVQQVELIRSFDNKRYVWPHIMDEVSRALPPYTWLVSITQTNTTTLAQPDPTPPPKSGKKPGPPPVDTTSVPQVRLHIVGNTVDIQALTRFMKVLEASPFIQDVQLAKSAIILVDGKEVTEFQLDASYQTPDPSAIRTVPVSLSVR